MCSRELFNFAFQPLLAVRYLMTLIGCTTHTQTFAEEVSPFTESLSTEISAVI